MLKVLIVEDSILLADMLGDYLESEGYCVCGIACTVADAVSLSNLHKPDLAILDYRLARGEYGTQVIPLLKDKFNIGILYVSGDPLGTILRKSDGDAYMQKPYGMKDIVKALHIIESIKSGSNISSEIYPKGFHPLGSPNIAEKYAA